MDELFLSNLDVYKNKPLNLKVFPKRIAFNLIPHIDNFVESSDTKEENKMIEETQKIFERKLKFLQPV